MTNRIRLAALAAALLGGALAARPLLESRVVPAAPARVVDQKRLPPVLPFVPTYSGHVKAILDANCVACHTDGGIAPFPLTSYASAAEHAREAQFAVQDRIMPPWLPGGDSPHFLNERRLSDDEIAIIANWAWAGAPEGKPGVDRVPAPSAAPAVRADLTVDTGRDFTPDASLSDEYRCFVADLSAAGGLSADRFLAGYDVVPGNRSLVHHVLLFELPASAEGAALALEARADGRGGWTCFGGPGVSGAQLLGGWAPGGAPVRFPDGTGMRLHAGSRLLLQVHYNLASGTGVDRSAVRLEFADAAARLEPMITYSPTAPVEIACPGPYPSNPADACHRDAAYAKVLALNDSAGNRRRRDGLLLAFCGEPLDRFTRGGAADHVTSACSYPAPDDVLVRGITGHMHYLGRSVRVEVNPGSADARTLLDIPRWDFHWQGFYWLRDPVLVRRGDRVRITCTFDNSAANQPWVDGVQGKPRYVVWGEGTSDEMCLSYIFATAVH